MLPIIGEVIGNLFGLGRDHLEGKRKLKKAKLDSQLAIQDAQAAHVITAAEAGQKADIDWDIQAMKNSGNSWKDEYLLIMFSPPLIMAFVPDLAPYVGLGFAELDKMPDWYMAALGTMVAATYGDRKLSKYFRKTNGAK